MTLYKGKDVKYMTVVAAAVVLAGCATHAPIDADYNQTVTTIDAWAPQPEATAAASLNDLIAAPALDAMIDEALRANPSLQQTWMSLQILRLESARQDGARYPELDAGYSITETGDQTTAHVASLSISWEVDLWGKLAQSYQAALKQSASQAALWQSARDTLVAEVGKAWLACIASDRALMIAGLRLQSLRKTESFTTARYRGGLATLEAQQTAYSAVRSAQAEIARYTEARAAARRALGLLLGRLNDDTLAIPSTYPAVTLVAADLPEVSMRRRPDLRAAYLQIEAYGHLSNVAYDELLPRIDLQATLQQSADNPARLFSADPVWTLLGQLTAPLYRAGQLRAAAEAADIEVAQAYESYRETLIGAVKEVRDALGNERAYAKRQGHLRAALESTDVTLQSYRRNYRDGLVDLLDLLGIEQQYYDLQAELDTLIYNRLTNRIDLALALGLGARQ